MVAFTSNASKAACQRGQHDAIYFDLKMAFDTVIHVVVLMKFFDYGGSGTLHLWFQIAALAKLFCACAKGANTGLLSNPYGSLRSCIGASYFLSLIVTLKQLSNI